MNTYVRIVLFLVLCISSVEAATLRGTIYTENLEPESDVILEINSTPVQKLLSREGTYLFILPLGEYILTAQKDNVIISEPVNIIQEGDFVFDLFLIPDLSEEADLLDDLREEVGTDFEDSPRTWAYVAAGIITVLLLWRIVKARQRYGPLPSWWKRKKPDASPKTSDELPTNEPSDLAPILDVLRKHEGRITQKELRQELASFSEAKVSLMVTELEHKGIIEKIKKGRGNVIIMKNNPSKGENGSTQEQSF